MKRFLLTSIFCVLCLMVVNTSAARAPYPSNQPSAITWWMKESPMGANWVRVTVAINRGFCIKSELNFYIDYVDQRGQMRRMSKGFYIKTGAATAVCSGTYYVDYEFEYSMAGVLGGEMFAQVIPRPRPVE